MRDNNAAQGESGELVCVWIPVQGADGRVHMEARWLVQSRALTQPAA